MKCNEINENFWYVHTRIFNRIWNDYHRNVVWLSEMITAHNLLIALRKIWIWTCCRCISSRFMCFFNKFNSKNTMWWITVHNNVQDNPNLTKLDAKNQWSFKHSIDGSFWTKKIIIMIIIVIIKRVFYVTGRGGLYDKGGTNERKI